MTILYYLIRRAPREMLFALAAAAVSGVSSTVLVAMVNSGLRSKFISREFAAGFCALCVLRLVAGVASGRALVRISQQMIRELRLDLSGKIVATSLIQLERIGSAKIEAALTEDVRDIAFVMTNVPYLCINIVIIVSTFIYIGYLSIHVCIGLVVCIGIGMTTYQIPVIKANRLLRAARDIQDILLAEFSKLTRGAKELKLSLGRQIEALHMIDAASAKQQRLNEAGGFLYTAVANWNRLLFFVYTGGVLYVAESAFMKVHGGPASVSAIVISLLYLMAPLEAVMNAIPHMARARMAFAKLDSLGLRLLAVPDVSRGRPQTWLLGEVKEIEIVDLEFEYAHDDGEREFASGPTTLTLSAGEVTFIVGGNGSGKTTLLKLISGLYSPLRGIIKVNGKVVSDDNRDEYRQLFGGVMSEFFLFDTFLPHMGKNGYSIDSYLEMLGVSKFHTPEAPKPLQTKASTGQRKRMALAVSLFEDRPVYLFDEWAADQEPAFKDFFYIELLPRLRKMGKIVLAISHDDRYFQYADKLIKMEDGRACRV